MAWIWIRLLSHISLAGMQLTWLYGVLAFLDARVAGGDLPVGGLLLFHPSALLLGMGLRRVKRVRWRFHVPFWMLWTLGILVFLRFQRFPDLELLDPAWFRSLLQAWARSFPLPAPEVLTILCSGGLWALGGRIGSIRAEFARAIAEFQFGLVCLVFLSLLAAQLGSPLPHALPMALSFSLFSLMAAAATHTQEGRAGAFVLGGTRWLGLLVITLLLVAVLGTLLVSVVTPEAIAMVLSTMEKAARWILQRIMELMAMLARLFPEPQPLAIPGPTPIPQQAQSEWVKWLILPDWARELGRWVVSLSWLVLIVVALWRISSQFFGWLRRRWTGLEDAEIEPMVGAFGEDLRTLLRNAILWVLRILRFRRRAVESAWSPEIASVRRTYRRMMRWAARRGHPREPAQTPAEYLETLVAALPGSRGDLGLITERYVRARYGLDPPSGEEVHEVERAWWRLRRSGRELRRRNAEPEGVDHE
jgi:hypothetical protein